MIYPPPHPRAGSLWRGIRVGLLGGSFNPPHKGHLYLAQLARRHLDLDAVWWLVSPQNPLKSKSDFMSYEERLQACRDMTASHPHMVISDIERQMGVNLTWRTVERIKRHFPATDFAFVMGMDNSLNFHLWQNWKQILDIMPTAHGPRPPATSLIRACTLRAYQRVDHRILDQPDRVSLAPQQCFWLLDRPMLDLSSSRLRQAVELAQPLESR